MIIDIYVEGPPRLYLEKGVFVENNSGAGYRCVHEAKIRGIDWTKVGCHYRNSVTAKG
jgi:hypothetical protein